MPAAPEKLEAVRQTLRLFKAMNPFSGEAPAQARLLLDGFAEPVPREADVREISINGVRAEWVTMPNVDPRRRFVYLHGGAYIAGSRKSHRALVARIAEACEAAALSVEYRLSPEHPYPAGLEDALTAIEYAARTGPWDETVPASKLFVGGDSAGGGLSLKSMIAARDRGGPRIDGAVLISPWTDLAGTGSSLKTREESDPMLSGKNMRRTILDYIGARDPRDPSVSPLYADLAGLPPMLIHVGDHEILLDDSLRLADRAKAANVDVTLRVFDEMFHVFHIFSTKLPEAREALAEIGAWVKSR